MVPSSTKDTDTDKARQTEPRQGTASEPAEPKQSTPGEVAEASQATLLFVCSFLCLFVIDFYHFPGLEHVPAPGAAQNQKDI